MGYNFALNDQELARSFSLRDNNRDEFFHSSGYADAQNSGKIGAASLGKTVAERQDLNESRRFVRGYENAGLNSQISITRERTRGIFDRERTATGDILGNNDAQSADGSERRLGEGGTGRSMDTGTKNTGETGGYRYHEDLARRQEAVQGATSREGMANGSAGINSYRDYTAAAKQNFSQRQSRDGSIIGGGGGYSRGYEGSYGGNGTDSRQNGRYSGSESRGRSGYGGSSIAKSFKPDFGMKFGSDGK